MQSKFLAIVLVAGSALAAPELQKRQATNPAEFSSAVNQLISAYVPASVALPLGLAIQSAASAQGITGDLSSVVANALAQPTPPPYLTAVPSQYQPNLASLGSAISALRGVASTGIPGAPIVSMDTAGNTVTVSTKDAVTTTNTAGSTIVAVTGPVTDSAGSTLTGVTSTISAVTGSPSASQPTGAVITTDTAGSTITGLAVTTVDSAGSTITSLTTTLSFGSNTQTINSVSGTTSATSSVSGVTTSSTTATSTATTTATSSSTVTSASTTTTATTTSSSPAPTSSSTAAAAGALAPGAGGVIGLVAFLLAL